VRKRFAYVVTPAGGTPDRPGKTQADAIIFGDAPDTFRALDINLVLRQEIFVFIQLDGEPFQELAHGLVESARQVFTKPADADVARKHPEPGNALVDVE